MLNDSADPPDAAPEPLAPGVTAVIPTIPPRAPLLARAVASVMAQTCPVAAISIAADVGREGAGPTRTRALMAVRTEWTAFLDDDDEWGPDHTDALCTTAAEYGADVVWSCFDPVGGYHPLVENEGRQWDPDNPHAFSFPITALVRTDLAQAVGFGPPRPNCVYSAEDAPFFIELSELGAVFRHVPVRTWMYHMDSANTSGRPENW